MRWTKRVELSAKANETNMKLPYPKRFPKVLRWPFKGALWRLPAQPPAVYLTFDDGPTPHITPWVMDRVEEVGGKATFFLVGNNVDNHPDIFLEIKNRGHAVGHHTQNHLNGWKTANSKYFEEVEKGFSRVQTKFFRPPYGRITPSQYKHLKSEFTIVLWDVLSGDFDTEATVEDVVENTLSNVQNGSIIVFHDSQKAWPRLETALPIILKKLKEAGYAFLPLESANTVRG